MRVVNPVGSHSTCERHVASASRSSWLSSPHWHGSRHPIGANSEALWSHVTLACTSDNFMAHFKLAQMLEHDENADAAIKHYRGG